MKKADHGDLTERVSDSSLSDAKCTNSKGSLEAIFCFRLRLNQNTATIADASNTTPHATDTMIIHNTFLLFLMVMH